MLSRFRTRVLAAAASAALAAAAVSACSEGGIDIELGSGGSSDELTEGRVTHVVDGDTIRIGDERIRLIGVDTPETRKPGSPVECFGKQATAFTKRLVLGRKVRLELDVEHRDRYGRLLAYVTRAKDGLPVNAELVRRGYALPLTVPPNVKRAAEYARLAGEARAAGRGLWSACR
jgi:micrococcal nuclease